MTERLLSAAAAAPDSKTWLVPAIAWGLAVLLIVCSHRLAGVVLKLAARLFGRRDKPFAEGAAGVLQTPLARFFSALLLLIASRLTPIPAPYDRLVEKLTDSLLIAACFAVLYTIARHSPALFVRAKQRGGEQKPLLDEGAAGYLGSALSVIVIILAVLAVLSVWVANIAGIITGLGIGGLAVALAAQDTLAHFLGSLSLMLDRPFVAGDYIETKDFEGTVVAVGLRSSRLRQPDNSIVHVPNKTLAAATITNLSQRRTRRIDREIYLTYDNTPAQIESFCAAVKALISSTEDTKPEGIVCQIDRFEERGSVLLVRYFTVEDYGLMLRATGHILSGITALAAAHGVSMARPLVLPVPAAGAAAEQGES